MGKRAKQSPPLLLASAIVGIAAKYMLATDPPKIWQFVLITMFTLTMCGLLYWNEQRLGAELDRRQDLEKDKRRAFEILEVLVKDAIGDEGVTHDTWTRPLVRQPLSQAAFDDGRDVLSAARDDAARGLSKLLGLDLEQARTSIRANVFLATADGVRNGDVCDLTIPRDDRIAPEGLQVNMVKGDEPRITFRPNQGATGKVFTEQIAVGALVNPMWFSGDDETRAQVERWEYISLRLTRAQQFWLRIGGRRRVPVMPGGHSRFEMTDHQNQTVAENLAWIISMPILFRVQNGWEVVGVLNVDCLSHRLNSGQLTSLYCHIGQHAAAMSGVLVNLPRDRVAIFRMRR